MKGKLSTDNPEIIRDGARKMFDMYASSLPETMTVEEFYKKIKDGQLVDKLMEIAEEITKKADL